MKQKLFGVVPPIITPVDEYERVDEKGLRLLIDHCIDHGIHGIFVCGSNGECMALTQEERDRAIRIALDECAGRVHGPVPAGDRTGHHPVCRAEVFPGNKSCRRGRYIG